MLLLFETPAGYGIFRLNDKKKLESVEDIYSMFQSDNLLDNVNLECFKKFKDTEMESLYSGFSQSARLFGTSLTVGQSW